MLHFCPDEPFGHDGSVVLVIVHCCEHTGWPSMSNESVQTMLVHSVDVFEAAVHGAPNAPAAGAAASGVVEPSPLVQAAASSAHSRYFMRASVARAITR
jgi:hypothetical protein